MKMNKIFVPVLGETGAHLPARLPVKPDRETDKSISSEIWPNDRQTETFVYLADWRMAETFVYLADWRMAETFVYLADWRVAETSGDLTKMVEDHTYLADGLSSPWECGRRPNPITINAQTEISKANPSSRIR